MYQDGIQQFIQSHIPEGLLARIRLLVLCFAVFMLLITIPDLIVASTPGMVRLAALAIGVVVAQRWVQWYRSGKPWGGDLVISGTAAALLFIAIPNSTMAMGSAYLSLCYLPMYRGNQWTAIGFGSVATGVVLGDVAQVYIGHSGLSIQAIAHLPGLAFATVLGWSITRITSSHEQTTAVLARSERLHRQLIEQLPCIVITVSLDGKLTYVSPEVESILGYTPREAVERLTGLVQSYIHPDDQQRMNAQVKTAYEYNAPLIQDFRFPDQSGNWIWLHMQAEIVRNDAGRPLYWLATLIDTTERKALEARLEHQATHDGLTELPNRATFRDRLQSAVDSLRSNDGRLAILFLDLDNFKLVNDSLGHNRGDDLIREVALRLQSTVRNGDTVSRLGGDEFTVLLEDLNSPADATVLANRVLECLQREFVLQGQHFNISASIGVVIVESADIHPEELIRRADMAMYEAKRRGKSQYVLHTLDLTRDAPLLPA